MQVLLKYAALELTSEKFATNMIKAEWFYYLSAFLHFTRYHGLKPVPARHTAKLKFWASTLLYGFAALMQHLR